MKGSGLHKKKSEHKKHTINSFSVVIQAFASIFICFLIEVISRHSISGAFNFMWERPLVFAYNAFLIFVTSLIVYLFRRRVFIRILLCIFWLALGSVNGFLLTLRVTPFTGPDLFLIPDALKVINIYLPLPLIILMVIGIVAVIGLLVLLGIKAPKYKEPLSYKKNILFFLIMCAAFWGVTNLALNKRVLSNYFGNIAVAYEDYGFPYCFLTTVFNIGIDCPPDYSEEAIQTIMNSVDANLPEEQEENEEHYPNIIFVQLESFFDPELVEYLELSQDPIPNFRKLSTEYSSGYLRVPSVGAGTANTEFEVITGMSMRYFGPGEYPYKTILQKTTCESMGFILKELGYTTHAIHNNEAEFYDRLNVFSKLGFDTFTSIEYMNVTSFTPTGWAKDEVLIEHIMNALHSTEDQDYIQTISVQGHGEYPTEQVIEDPLITVSGVTGEEKYAWEYYVNQLYEMDQFIEELIAALSELEEDTVLVLYGDHLPTMGLTARDLQNRYLFQTEYVIWDNMGLEKDDQNITSYQIGSVILEQLDIHTGTIFTYHQARRNTQNYQVDLEVLQYDILYGERYIYGGVNPFEATKLQMGVKPITITSASNMTDGNVQVYGENFTSFSRVEVNGETLETIYVNNKLLEVEDYSLKDGDVIVINQVSASAEKSVLSSSAAYIWHEP